MRWIRDGRVVVAIVAVLALVTFFKIAWVTDDAYIGFRSLEQLFDGHGPRWNPHERVQVYTSPLWFWLLALARSVSSDVYANAIVLSALFFVIALVMLRRLLPGGAAWAAAVLILLASNGFYDYTSSGLENALGYALLLVFLDAYRRVLRRDGGPVRLALAFGLLLTCRHDLSTLTLVPFAYALWRTRQQLDARAWLGVAAAAFGPILMWTLFSLVYYGAPLPNTAYAKLASGLPHSRLFAWGLGYIVDTLRYDTITVVIAFGAAAWLIARGPAPARAIAAGILLNLCYVIWAGGDFMRGRFFAFSYLLATAALLLYAVERRPRVTAAIAGLALVYGVVYPHTPLNSAISHRVEVERPAGAIDERGFYWQASFLRYLRHEGDVFPDQQWALAGAAWSHGRTRAVERGVIGYFGYWAGTEKIIIDSFGLADPFLARLPADPERTYRVGHFVRDLPAGYRELVMMGSGRLIDPQLNAFYEHLALITQGEHLFAGERLRAIIALNLGRYDHYLAGSRGEPARAAR